MMKQLTNRVFHEAVIIVIYVLLCSHQIQVDAAPTHSDDNIDNSEATDRMVK